MLDAIIILGAIFIAIEFCVHEALRVKACQVLRIVWHGCIVASEALAELAKILFKALGVAFMFFFWVMKVILDSNDRVLYHNSRSYRRRRKGWY